MEQREELEIETRLRAALAARSELVTHSTLRPGIPPNEHTAGLKAQHAGRWSWRRFLVPVTVAAALGGGVFVGTQLSDKSGSQANGPAASGYPPRVTSTTGAPSGQATQPGAQGLPAAPEGAVGALRFVVADGWQVTALDAASACVAPKGSVALGGASGTPSGTQSATATGPAKSGALPCGLDALYLKSDAAADAWPRSTATKATGWWPKAVDAPSEIVCPAGKHDASNHVTDSVSLRSSAKYVLGGGAAANGAAAGAPATAEYHEWAVTCDEGPGVRPMLWELLPAGGAASGGKTAVAAVVSSDPAYDTALLGMVGSLHLAG